MTPSALDRGSGGPIGEIDHEQDLHPLVHSTSCRGSPRVRHLSDSGYRHHSAGKSPGGRFHRVSTVSTGTFIFHHHRSPRPPIQGIALKTSPLSCRLPQPFSRRQGLPATGNSHHATGLKSASCVRNILPQICRRLAISLPIRRPRVYPSVIPARLRSESSNMPEWIPAKGTGNDGTAR